MKNDVKFVVLVAIGVMVAGYMFNVMKDVEVVRTAADGFDL